MNEVCIRKGMLRETSLQLTENRRSERREMAARVFMLWRCREMTVRAIGKTMGLTDTEVYDLYSMADAAHEEQLYRKAFAEGRRSVLPKPVVVMRRAA